MGLPFTTLAPASTKMQEVLAEVVDRVRLWPIDLTVGYDETWLRSEAFVVEGAWTSWQSPYILQFVKLTEAHTGRPCRRSWTASSTTTRWTRGGRAGWSWYSTRCTICASVISLLSKDFLRIIVIAFVVAAQVAYVLVQRWLEDFGFRIDISWPIFLIVGRASLVIALLTVSDQTVRAALADPFESLHYE